MKLSTTLGYFLENKYSAEQGVEICAKAGFDAVDYSFHSDPTSYDEASVTPAGQEKFKSLRAFTEDKGLVFNQAHAPFPSSTDDPLKNKEIFNNITRSMKNAATLGAPNIVVHPMQHLTYWEEGVPEKLFEMNMDFYNRLKPYAEEYGIKICVENMYKGRAATGNRYVDHSVCSRASEFVQYLDALDRNVFVGCFDIGHALLCRENPDDFIRTLGKERLKALHVHDVNADEDMHTLPYYGGAGRWESICKALKEIGYTGDFTYEANNFTYGLPEKLLLPAMTYAAEVGRYLISVIEE